MGEFVPFPLPAAPSDAPLVVHAGDHYSCTGCGDDVPAGVWLYETVVDGTVTGLLAQEGHDGPVVHVCGDAAGHGGFSWPPSS
jgi:hypothetical protein